MNVLVTGAKGKVGGAVVAALQAAGHEVVATDLARPTFERQAPGEPAYLQADLTDAGHAYAVVGGADAVVQAAAIPDPLHHPSSAVRRSWQTKCLSVRPSWVQWEGNYQRNLGPDIRDPQASAGFWSSVDVDDLAELVRLAVESDVPGHEVVYAASPDNSTGRPLAELVRRHYGDRIQLRPLAREDACGISCAKAERLLGWRPTRSWRDYLDEHGRLRPLDERIR
jgi:nucleoside-diphosphate-sugar epimerase